MQPNLIFQAVVSKLEQFQPLSKHLQDALLPLLSELRVPKGQILIRSGERSSRLWFLYEGFAREISHDEASERTTWFFSPNDFLFAYPSFFSQLPAFRDIEIISDSILVELSFRNLILMRRDFEELVGLVDVARDYCEMERARFVSMRDALSAQDRYDRYYADHKQLFNFAKHKDIANLLGIKADGLRRYNH
ncbi:Crp/Fnr family transcriptional regulator [Pedobacter mucosus]|uniref:Crp/Fnr family transcriptional regulator n=1 Tax=Pedobacter mucosus TaxID=2895286 RepID=UPI001EE44BC7|nr:cyclic nucleotide-binding domain-containing protein [Pedobacter mucosus]UKT65049.1 cyclic nucleotide-binding domain-containing protein [Pedobacter mucosus]